MTEAKLTIRGMSCGHCVKAVQGALSGLEGVSVDNVAIGTARVHYDPAKVTPDRIVDAVEEEGYEAELVGA